MSIYEEVEIEDMEWEEEEQQYTYPCPCGDKFIITLVRFFPYMCVCVCSWIDEASEDPHNHSHTPQPTNAFPQTPFLHAGRALGRRGRGPLPQLHAPHPGHLRGGEPAPAEKDHGRRGGRGGGRGGALMDGWSGGIVLGFLVVCVVVRIRRERSQIRNFNQGIKRVRAHGRPRARMPWWLLPKFVKLMQASKNKCCDKQSRSCPI